LKTNLRQSEIKLGNETARRQPLEDENSHLNNLNIRLQDVIKQLESDKTKLESDIRKLELEKQKLVSEQQKLESETQKLESDKKKLESGKHKLTSDYDKLYSEMKAWKEECLDLRDDIKNANKELSSLKGVKAEKDLIRRELESQRRISSAALEKPSTKTREPKGTCTN
jgi:peptidoglycan hydrolase CwlO-like protein